VELGLHRATRGEAPHARWRTHTAWSLVVFTVATCLGACPDTPDPLDPFSEGEFASPAPLVTSAPERARAPRDVLASTGDDVLDRALHDDDHDTRLEALRTIVANPSPDHVQTLAGLLGDPDMRIRREAATALALLGTHADEAGEALAIALLDEFAIVRARALAALIRIGTPRAQQILRSYLQTVPEEEIDQALDAVASVDDVDAIPYIRTLLDHQDPYVRSSATRALVRLGAPSAAVFRERLQHTDRTARCNAAYALAWVGSADDTDVLDASADHHDDPHYALCATAASIRLGAERSMDTIVQAAFGPDHALQSTAFDALAMTGTAIAAEQLVALTATGPDAAPPPDMERLTRALISMGDVARTPVIRALEERGQTHETSFNVWTDVIAAIGSADDVDILHALQDSLAMPVTQRALQDAIRAIESRQRRPQ